MTIAGASLLPPRTKARAVDVAAVSSSRLVALTSSITPDDDLGAAVATPVPTNSGEPLRKGLLPPASCMTEA